MKRCVFSYGKLPLGIQMWHARVRNSHLEVVVSSLASLTPDNLHQYVNAHIHVNEKEKTLPCRIRSARMKADASAHVR